MENWTFVARDGDGQLHVAKTAYWTRNQMDTACGKRNVVVISLGSVESVKLEAEKDLCAGCLIKEVVP